MGNLFKTHSQSFGIVALVAITISTFIVFLAAKEQKDIRGRAAQITTTEKPAPQKISRAKTSAVLADVTGPNLVTNGDFSQGETGWEFNSIDTSHKAENGVLSINVSAGRIVTLTPNTVYSLTAKVTPNNYGAVIYIRANKNDFSYIAMLNFNNTGNSETKNTTFTSPSSGSVYITLHSSNNNYANINMATFENVGIYEVAPTPTSTPTPTNTPTPTLTPTPTPIPNHVGNGDFSSGDSGWAFTNGFSHNINNGALEISSTSTFNGQSAARQDLNLGWTPLSPNTVYKLTADVKNATATTGTKVCIGRAGTDSTRANAYKCLEFNGATMENKSAYFQTLNDNVTYTVALFKGNTQTATFDNIGVFDAQGITLTPTSAPPTPTPDPSNLLPNPNFLNNAQGWDLDLPEDNYTYQANGATVIRSSSDASQRNTKVFKKDKIYLPINSTFKLKATVISSQTPDSTASNAVCIANYNQETNCLNFTKNGSETKELIFKTFSTDISVLTIYMGKYVSQATFEDLGIYLNLLPNANFSSNAYQWDLFLPYESYTYKPNGVTVTRSSSDASQKNQKVLNRSNISLPNNSTFKLMATVTNSQVPNSQYPSAVCVLYFPPNGEDSSQKCINFSTANMETKEIEFNSYISGATVYLLMGKDVSQATFEDLAIFEKASVPTPTTTPTSRLFADVDGNGCISITDFSEWVYAFKNSTLTNPNNPNSKPDVNGDGQVSILDFNDWLRVFKSGANACN